MRKLVAFLAVAALTAVDQINGLSCRNCYDTDCAVPKGCKYGQVKDVCACCDVCAKGPGDNCGGLWGIEGRCGEGYTCDTSHNEELTPGYPEGFQSGICTEDPQFIKTPSAPHKMFNRPRGGGASGLVGSGRVGQAKAMAKQHRYQTYGSSIPAEYAALLPNNRRRGKRSLLGNSRLVRSAYGGIPEEYAEFINDLNKKAGGRAKRALLGNPRAGGAKRLAKKHKHITSGGIPPEFAALMNQYRKKNRG